MSKLIDNNPCLTKARDDEPAFIILGRDPAAVVALEAWCDERWRLIHTGLLADNAKEIGHIKQVEHIKETFRNYRPKSVDVLQNFEIVPILK